MCGGGGGGGVMIQVCTAIYAHPLDITMCLSSMNADNARDVETMLRFWRVNPTTVLVVCNTFMAIMLIL